ncbi:hypothetical protein AA15237_2729 [Komagataeibacter xylinus NBRC 15237]|nr:hypothetical protein AA15237_2729 [Komagataeibacter xylinus NBRC 15237]
MCTTMRSGCPGALPPDTAGSGAAWAACAASTDTHRAPPRIYRDPSRVAEWRVDIMFMHHMACRKAAAAG